METKKYIRWLNGKTGGEYRLLTESEWEYAARAGTTGPFSFEEPISSDKANYMAEMSYNSSPTDEWRQMTVPVGTLPNNAFGLYEMHGNAYEWVEDCWFPSYEGAPTDGSARTKGSELNCRFRVLMNRSNVFL